MGSVLLLKGKQTGAWRSNPQWSNKIHSETNRCMINISSTVKNLGSLENSLCRFVKLKAIKIKEIFTP